MIKLTAFLMAMLLAMGTAQAVTFTGANNLCWTEVTQDKTGTTLPTPVGGYRVLWGTSTGNYQTVADVVRTATPSAPCQPMGTFGFPNSNPNIFLVVIAYKTGYNDSTPSAEYTFTYSSGAVTTTTSTTTTTGTGPTTTSTTTVPTTTTTVVQTCLAGRCSTPVERNPIERNAP